MQIMHRIVSHSEGKVKSARVWHLAWAFGEPKSQNRVSIQAAAKPSVGHTLALSPPAVQCRIEMYIAQYPQKWY